MRWSCIMRGETGAVRYGASGNLRGLVGHETTVVHSRVRDVRGGGSWGNTRDVAGSFDLYFASRDRDKARRYCERFDGARLLRQLRGGRRPARRPGDVFFDPPRRARGQRVDGGRALQARAWWRSPSPAPWRRLCGCGDACADAGVRLMVAENHRFLPTVVRAKELLDSGEIGDLRAVNMTCDWFGDTGGWRNSLEMAGGGSFMDAGIHYADTLVLLGGMPEQLYAASPPAGTRQGGRGRHLHRRSPCRAAPSPRSSSRTERDSAMRDSRIVVAGTQETLFFHPFGDKIERQSLDGGRLEPVGGLGGSSATAHGVPRQHPGGPRARDVRPTRASPT